MVSFSPVSVVHNFHVDDDERQSKVDAYAAVMEQALANRAESELELAATRAQAAVRGHLTRLGLAARSRNPRAPAAPQPLPDACAPKNNANAAHSTHRCRPTSVSAAYMAVFAPTNLLSAAVRR
jgi:hypothetical protein